MQILKVAPLRATVLLIAGVLLLFYVTCVSAEVSQHRGRSLMGKGTTTATASAQKTLKAQEAVLSRTNKTPTKTPTKAPTEAPTKPPTEAPTKAPTRPPTPPTEAPTKAPTKPPTKAPTEAPTKPPTPFDWTQCKSEGGTKNCAKCKGGDLDDNGALPCNNCRTVVTTSVPGQQSVQIVGPDCPDNDLWKGMFFEASNHAGTPMCTALTTRARASGRTLTTYVFPGGIGNSSADKLDRNLVATKALVAHPDYADANVGAVMFKRMVMHQCTGTRPEFCKEGDKVADVFKQGYCVKCKSKKYTRADCGDNCTVFGGSKALYVTEEQERAFVKECFSEAFTSEGVMKADYQCSADDMMYASASIAMF